MRNLKCRYGSLGVLFDILKLHGNSFTREFWIRVYDSILLPMFDHVRAEVTDTTTFSDEVRRAEADAWLYETCTTSLQYLVDVVAQYHRSIPELLIRSLELLAGFIRRNHNSIAAVGVAALTQLTISCGKDAKDETWTRVIQEFESGTKDTLPDLPGLLAHRSKQKGEIIGNNAKSWSLGDGAGARKLSEIQCRASVQLLLAQACGEVYSAHSRNMPKASAIALLDILKGISEFSIKLDADEGLRHSLLMAQAADNVPENKILSDPPFLHLEIESSQAYISVLMSISAQGGDLAKDADIQTRICDVCLQNLERFERQSAACQEFAEKDGSDALMEENSALAPLAVATLKALLSMPKDIFASKVKEFYPTLTNLIASDVAPQEVQTILSELFSDRISSLMQ